MIKQYLILTISILLSGICNSQINQLDDNEQRHGKWEVNFEDSSHLKFEGSYVHGKRTGKFRYYKKGSYAHPAAIMDFDRPGDSVKATYYTQQGKTISEGILINRKREGKWLYYHQDSDSIMMSEVYKNDSLNGLQKTFFPNGRLAEKTHYKNGFKDGESYIYADNAQVTSKLNYKDGQLHGPANYYTPEGKPKMEGSYTNGEKSGHWKYFSNGKLDREEDY